MYLCSLQIDSKPSSIRVIHSVFKGFDFSNSHSGIHSILAPRMLDSVSSGGGSGSHALSTKSSSGIYSNAWRYAMIVELYGIWLKLDSTTSREDVHFSHRLPILNDSNSSETQRKFLWNENFPEHHIISIYLKNAFEINCQAALTTCSIVRSKTPSAALSASPHLVFSREEENILSNEPTWISILLWIKHITWSGMLDENATVIVTISESQ